MNTRAFERNHIWNAGNELRNALNYREIRKQYANGRPSDKRYWTHQFNKAIDAAISEIDKALAWRGHHDA